MKKIIIGLSLLLSLSSCGNDNNVKEDLNKKEVVEVENEDLEKSSQNDDSNDITSSALEYSKEDEDAKTSSEGELSEIEQVLGHSLEDSVFQIAHTWDDANFQIKLASDGTFVGGYKGIYTNATMPEPVYVLCDIKGKFTLGDKVDDYIYDLKLSDVEMTSTPGVEIDLGDKKGVYADYIPMFNEEAQYRLGLAGASLPDVASREESVFKDGPNETGILKHNAIYEIEYQQPYFEIQGTEPTTISLSQQKTSDKVTKDSSPAANFSEILGHDVENYMFSLAKLMGYNFTDFFLEEDGSFKGSFVERGSNVETLDLEFKKSEFKGRFELGEEVDDKTYKLYLTELEVTTPTGEKTMVFDPDQDKEVRQTYVDSTPGLSKDRFYHLVLKGSTNPTALDALNRVYQKDDSKTKDNVIMEANGNPVFYENVKRDENGNPVIDIPEGVFEDLDGMVLDDIFGASQITRTIINFNEDGSFEGDYRTGDTRKSKYHDALQANAKKLMIYAYVSSSFEGSFEIVDSSGDGIYDLKLVDLEVTSDEAMDENESYMATVDFVDSMNIDDNFMLIEPGAYVPLELRKGTALENFFNPPASLVPDVREDYSYGFILYNISQDIVLTDWRID